MRRISSLGSTSERRSAPDARTFKGVLSLSVEKLGQPIFYLHVSDTDGRVNESRTLSEGTIEWEGVIAAPRKLDSESDMAPDIGPMPDLEDSMRCARRYLTMLLDRWGSHWGSDLYPCQACAIIIGVAVAYTLWYGNPERRSR